MLVVVGGHARNIGKTAVVAHVAIGDKARIESRAVLESTAWGTPARPLRQYLQRPAKLEGTS